MTGNPFGERTPAQHALLSAGWAELDEPARTLIWDVAGRLCNVALCMADVMYRQAVERAARTMATNERNQNKGKHWVPQEPLVDATGAPTPYGRSHRTWVPDSRKCQYDPCDTYYERSEPNQKFCTPEHRKANDRLKREWCEE